MSIEEIDIPAECIEEETNPVENEAETFPKLKLRTITTFGHNLNSIKVRVNIRIEY